MERVRVQSVCKEYPGGVMANKDISFRVNAGECLCILGPNGAGKTTLVSQIASFQKPSNGSVHVCGVDVAADALEAKKHMGIMPQVCAPFMHLTVRQHFKIFAQIKNVAQASCDALLTALGLDEFMNAPIGLLSLGQKRKLLLATAFLGDPEVLLLDEPTTGLSPESRIEVWNIIKQRIDGDTAVILTTHMFEEAEALADRIVILHQGTLVFEGRKQDLHRQSEDKYELSYRDLGVRTTLRFKSFGEATSFVSKTNLQDFTLSPASLESLYFQIIGAQ